MELVVACIGKIAQQMLGKEERLTVLGAVSQGIFLQTSTGWVVFLSLGKSKGPLTLNLHEGTRVLPSLVPGSLVHMRDAYLYFRDQDMAVWTGEAIPWDAPPPIYLRSSPNTTRARLLNLGRRMLNFPGRESPDRLLRCTLRVLESEDYLLQAYDDPGIQNLAVAVSALQDTAMLSAL
jgi:hypothetical protein